MKFTDFTKLTISWPWFHQRAEAPGLAGHASLSQEPEGCASFEQQPEGSSLYRCDPSRWVGVGAGCPGSAFGSESVHHLIHEILNVTDLTKSDSCELQ